MNIYRQSRHPLFRWWHSLDTIILVTVGLIILLGGLSITTASVAAAPKYGVGPYYFAIKQGIFLMLAVGIILGLSFMSPTVIKRGAILLAMATFGGMILTLLVGEDVKGASRWIQIAGFNLQPSEIMKPAFVMITAMLISHQDMRRCMQGFFASGVILAMVGVLLLGQPDIGMLLLMSSIWMLMSFIAGIPLLVLLPLVVLGLGAAGSLYLFFPHVQSRVNRFITSEGQDTYQVDQAREAILTGHLLGRGAGEGVVKHTLPDAHTDFIFAVIAEEFGILVCLFLLILYAVFAIYGFYRAIHHENRFVLVAVCGLLTLLTLQVIINIMVALHLLPTTGMALPLISYGGSATIGAGLSIGCILALLRERRQRIST